MIYNKSCHIHNYRYSISITLICVVLDIKKESDYSDS